MNQNLCKICKNGIIGRTDKLFCSIACKSKYHKSLRGFVKDKTIVIDKILHRNRAILQEVLGKSKDQIKVNRLVLSKINFQFKYHTHSYVNKAGKTFNYVYDLAWMEFSDDEILIVNSRK